MADLFILKTLYLRDVFGVYRSVPIVDSWPHCLQTFAGIVFKILVNYNTYFFNTPTKIQFKWQFRYKVCETHEKSNYIYTLNSQKNSYSS
jgi:hypothetical protein